MTSKGEKDIVVKDPNIIVRDDKEIFEDFDGDDSMETMLKKILFKEERKNATLMDKFSFALFIVFLLVNVGCASYNLYKALTTKSDNTAKSLIGTQGNYKAAILGFNSSLIINSNSTTPQFIIDQPTKILYYTEFSIIVLFALIAIYYYIVLYIDPKSEYALSYAANFTRLVREFSCFTLVPLFSVSTILKIYQKIKTTFDDEKKKYADRSELWDGIWGIGTKDVQKSTSALDLVVENGNSGASHKDNNSLNLEEQDGFKKFKHSKFFLRMASIFIYIGFIMSFLALIILAILAFVALFIKTRHVGNFITTGSENNVYKYFNFITFIMNIASLSQESPAIMLIVYQLRVLTKKAHANEYHRRKQNRIKENKNKFDADEDTPGIQPPKIIIHRKKISRTMDDSDLKKYSEEHMNDLDTDKLIPGSNALNRQNSLSGKSTNSY